MTSILNSDGTLDESFGQQGIVSFKLKVKKGIRGSHQLTFKGQDAFGSERFVTLTLNVQ